MTSPPFRVVEPPLYDWRGDFRKFYQLQQQGRCVVMTSQNVWWRHNHDFPGLLCDMVLQASDDTIPVHSIVLYTRVPYFRGFLTFNKNSRLRAGALNCDVTAGAPKCDVTADLKDYSARIVGLVLEYVYTGHLAVPSFEDLIQVGKSLKEIKKHQKFQLLTNLTA